MTMLKGLPLSPSQIRGEEALKRQAWGRL